MIIAGEPKRGEYLSPLLEKFGVCFIPGTLVQPIEEFPADLLVVRSTLAGAKLSALMLDGGDLFLPCREQWVLILWQTRDFR
ncbi:MAG: hypothetical protein ACLTZT_07275 [Butyricimonas faecalis]